jgi:hypothetical protein
VDRTNHPLAGGWLRGLCFGALAAQLWWEQKKTIELTNMLASKRKAGSSASGSVPKKTKAQKGQSRVQSKDRVLDKTKYPRQKKDGKALVWSFFEAGFTVFKNLKDPELKKLVVCETCVANDSPQDAEFTYGGSTSNVEHDPFAQFRCGGE